MKYRLQDKLQSQVAAVLPGYQVKCEFSSHNVIDVSLIEPATREAIRISGVTMQSLLGPGALDEVVDQLVYEIVFVARTEANCKLPGKESE